MVENSETFICVRPLFFEKYAFHVVDEEACLDGSGVYFSRDVARLVMAVWGTLETLTLRTFTFETLSTPTFRTLFSKSYLFEPSPFEIPSLKS